MGRHKHPILVTPRGPRELRDAAKQRATSSGTSLATLVRQWIEHYVKTGTPK